MADQTRVETPSDAPTLKRAAPDSATSPAAKKLDTGKDEPGDTVDSPCKANNPKPAPAPAPATATAKPTLLTLPAEIRNQIYEYVLGGVMAKPEEMAERKRTACCVYGEGTFGMKPWTSHIALLSVCRAIHAETKLLPWRLNTFSIVTHVGHFTAWLSFLGAAKAAAITTVFVRRFNDACGEGKLMDLLDRLPGLQVIVHELGADGAGVLSALEAYAVVGGMEVVQDLRATRTDDAIHERETHFVAAFLCGMGPISMDPYYAIVRPTEESRKRTEDLWNEIYKDKVDVAEAPVWAYLLD